MLVTDSQPLEVGFFYAFFLPIATGMPLRTKQQMENLRLDSCMAHSCCVRFSYDPALAERRSGRCSCKIRRTPHDAVESFYGNGEGDRGRHTQKKNMNMARVEGRIILAIECGHCRHITGMKVYNETLYTDRCSACGQTFRAVDDLVHQYALFADRMAQEENVAGSTNGNEVSPGASGDSSPGLL